MKNKPIYSGNNKLQEDKYKETHKQVLKVKDEKKNLESNKRKMAHHFKRTSVRLTVDFPAETVKGKRQ